VPPVVPNYTRHAENHHEIHRCQQEPQYCDSRKMLVQELVILGNVFVVEIGDPKIEQDIEKKSEIEYRKIKTVFARGYHVLNGAVDTKNPEWLNQQIKKKQKTKVGYKFTFHWSAL
jgi:hypothetical protein